MYWLFISDLHLEEQQPELTAFFFQVLHTYRDAERIFILGDWFESWIGDDDDAPWLQEIVEQLVPFRGKLAFMHGNRDFLINHQWCDRIGAQLLPETCKLQLPNGADALLTHGDLLCTGDHEYLKYRSMVRNPQWQQSILGQPLEQRRMLAQMLRQKSMLANSAKSVSIMDVEPSTVDELMQQQAVSILIHGHTHRPAMHQRRNYQRWVLGDWTRESTHILLAHPDGMDLCRHHAGSQLC